jgi:outer membrane protein OmpA-like peptidoglycan-associated protein
VKRPFIFFILLWGLALPAWAVDIAGMVNTYVKGDGDVAAGATTINYTGSFRGASNAINTGDLLLLIQSQGAVIDSSNTDTYGDGVGQGLDISTTPTSAHGTSGYAGGLITQTAGTFEYATVASVNGSQITLTAPLKHAYSDANEANWQIIVVPDYLTAGATLTADITGEAWDGDTGGVIAFNATGGILNFNGFNVNASGIGFRGGVDGDIWHNDNTVANVVDVTSLQGGKGEGIAGTPKIIYDGSNIITETSSTLAGGDFGRGAPGNAGGGAGPHNSGGGGGSNAGRGGSGAQGWVGGTPIQFAGYGGQSIFAGANMGGGGGSGEANDGGVVYGGLGGGAILIRADSGTGSGTLDVSGADAPDALVTSNFSGDGAGGGGAGGTILAYFSSPATLTSLNIDASGGSGGDASLEHGGGGGGGAGLVAINTTVGTINISGGAKGANQGLGGVVSEPGADGVAETSANAFVRLNTDFGDAPDSYGTISGGQGAYHFFADYDFNGVLDATEQLRLGVNLDGEGGGNPSTGANSDDTIGVDDEDGVSGLTQVDPQGSDYTISASNIIVTNTLASTATLHAWIDFDLNGTFDSDEYTSIPIASGLNEQNPATDLVWNTMPGITAVTPGSTTYLRLRLSTDSSLDATRAIGEAENGEVEDYALTVYDAIPTAQNVTRSNPTASITNANQLVFAVTFSESVQNVDTADFSVSGAGSTGASVSAVSGSGSSYTVTVDVADTDGLVNLDIAATTGIQDFTGNNLSTVTPAGSVESYTLDNTAPVISLIGSDPVDIDAGTSYSDAGASAVDSLDGDITGDIVTVNPVNTSVPGSYTVTYNVTDAAGNAATEVTRVVNVADFTPPVITLLGSDPVNIQQDGTYTDAGATALDGFDGDITGDIVTVNPVNTSVLGSYTVTYNVSDAAGNAATQVTRVVNVTSDSVPPVITLLGSNPVDVPLSSSYSDAGATASDDVDGDISSSIVTVNPVDTMQVGSYTVTYNVSDAAGNSATQVTRTVNVTFDSAPDSDGDGIANGDEGTGDFDNDGVLDFMDLDSDNDGIPDAIEGNVDTDADGVPDYLDLDSDNDGLYDLIESGADYATLDTLHDGMVDSSNSVGANGLADAVETSADSGTLNYNSGSPLDSDADGVEDYVDLDSDNDGLTDVIEAGGVDPDADGIVGNGVPTVDAYGVATSGAALTPIDNDGDGVNDQVDLDSDNDGIMDVVESGGDDPDGDGQVGNAPAQVDSNGLSVDGSLSALDTDGDGVPNQHDLDSDNDGIPDVTEAGADDADGDGIPGTGTPTVNAQGIANGQVLTPTDTDADSRLDPYDLDSDADGIYDLVEGGGTDSNNDGLVDGFTDSNGDGFDDGIAASALPVPDSDADGIADYQDNDDTDNDGIPDSIDIDDDNDGIPDALEGDGSVDTDNDGIPDSLDLDSDNDGLYDLNEAGFPNPSSLDSDNDGRLDSSLVFGSNGLVDSLETIADSGVINYNGGTALDTDADGVKDFRDLDSDNDSIPDVIESDGVDGDGDGVLGTGVPTVNSNGLATGAGSGPLDTDADGVPDQQDLDTDNDGIPDLQEVGGSDSDNNGVVDTFVDTNGDGFNDVNATKPLTLPDSDGDGTADLRDSAASNGVVSAGLNGIGAFNLYLLGLLGVLAGLRRAKLLISSLLSMLVLFVLPAQAIAQQTEQPQAEQQQDGYQRHFYIGAGLGRSTLQPDTSGTAYTLGDDSDTGYRLYGGMDLSESFSVELSLSDLGSANLKPTGKLDYSINAVNVLYYLYNQGEMKHVGMAAYLKAGLGKMDVSADIPYELKNSTQIALGAGLEYAWENGFALRADLESFDEDASLLSVGLLYRFGKQQKPEPKDSDQDGVLDKNDQCPQTPLNAPVNAEGCQLDSDKDGVVDLQDQCPQTQTGAAVDSTGCELDMDGDGVKDSKDQCPQTAQGVAVDSTGCALDSDGDGVIDTLDQCPATPAGIGVDKQGCALFNAPLAGVNFKLASAELTSSAKLVLDDAAKLLLQYPAVHIEIQAHTDSQGKKENNQKLSELRAQSVFEYLQSKGIEAKRMTPVGFGESIPLASNKTAEGRAKNRRVEFKVIQ